jgi:hypothetical protein
MGGHEVAPPFQWSRELPYLAFAGAMAAAAVFFTFLAIIAMKKRWQWQPGRKTVVWAVGLASLFIFAQVMFHVGYNLRPATQVAGRNIRNPFSYDTEEALKMLHFRRETKFQSLNRSVPGWGDSVCCKNDLMFIASIANEHMTDPNTSEGYYLQHAVLYIYRFPYEDATDSLIGALDLSRSPSIILKMQSIGTMGLWVKDNWLYVCYRPLEQDPKKKDDLIEGDIRIVAVDVSNPAAPVMGGEVVVNCGGRQRFARANVVVKGDYCYLKAGVNLAIISLETPGEPRLVKEVPFASLTPMSNWAGIPTGAFIDRFTVADNMLLVSTDIHLGAFDISDPANPRTLFFDDLRTLGLPYKDGRDWYVTTWNGNYCYLATREGLYVVKLLKDRDGKYSFKYVGVRKTTPLEKLARFEPRQLMICNGYLVEAAGPFGLLVYDISDPAHPRRLYHANLWDCGRVDILNGLLYVQGWDGKATLFDLPKAPSHD